MAEARVGPRFEWHLSAGLRWAAQDLGFALHSPICRQLNLVFVPCGRVPGCRVVKRAESSMTVFVAGRGHRPLLFAGLGCLAVAFAVVMHSKTALAADPASESTLREPITVNLDQAKLVKLP